MKKAEEHFNCRGQRLSIQLPSESAVQQSITNSFQQTPIKERKDTQFPFDVPGSPGQPYCHTCFVIVELTCLLSRLLII